MNRTSPDKPRVLIVTPEITHLPEGMGNMANALSAKAGGLADVSAALVSALFKRGADVHVTLPHYRRMFHVDVGNLISDELRLYNRVMPDSRIHLAQDRAFFYRNEVYSSGALDSRRLALAFQREVINNIVPRVKPDLIHCNDWMTGLIPAMARRLNIPCLFTVHNIHTQRITLAEIEDRGIDAADFWKHLYYHRPPADYEESRGTNPVNLLASGVFAAHFINTVSPTFLAEVCEGRHDFVEPAIRSEMAAKQATGCALGILNAVDPAFCPATDPNLARRYGPDDHDAAKRANKLEFQERTGLLKNDRAPLFFWPSRLDPVQKGCQLLAEILYSVVSDYWPETLQIAIVANGAYQKVFRDIASLHDFHERLAVVDFDDSLSHLGYAASDFVLMPSRFEPCGLPQMIGAIYGALPVAQDTGGLHDTVMPLSDDGARGNGFLFETHDSNGLRWAMDRAMDFHHRRPDARERIVARVMTESAVAFSHDETARHYIELYERMLRRPLIVSY